MSYKKEGANVRLNAYFVDPMKPFHVSSVCPFARYIVLAFGVATIF
jgi:hypothetical protein